MHASVILWTLLAQGLTVTATPAKPAPLAPVPDREVIVEAGEFDRQDVLVPVEMHTDEALRRWRLLDAGGRPVPFQVDQRGRGMFVLKALARGAKTKFRLVEDRTKAPRPAPGRVKVDGSHAGVLRVLVDGKPALEYQGALPRRTDVPPSVLRSGYIDPVFTPGGVKVTESLPSEQQRHLGIWSFWKQFQTQKQTVDFWDRVGTSGTIQMESMGGSWDGPVHGGFESRQIYTGIQGLGGATLLRDNWRVQVYAVPGGKSRYYLIDLETEQSAATPNPVSIPKGMLGGVAVRGRGAWAKGPGGLVRMTSDRNPKETRLLWAYLGGSEGGKTAGIAVLGFPGNIGSPQYLDPTLGDRVLNLSATHDQAIPIEPYRPFRQLYRFVALDGPPDAKLLSRLYNDFAFPPRASLQAAAAKP
jgi:hypothetical protein